MAKRLANGGVHIFAEPFGPGTDQGIVLGNRQAGIGLRIRREKGLDAPAQGRIALASLIQEGRTLRLRLLQCGGKESLFAIER